MPPRKNTKKDTTKDTQIDEKKEPEQIEKEFIKKCNGTIKDIFKKYNDKYNEFNYKADTTGITKILDKSCSMILIYILQQIIILGKNMEKCGFSGKLCEVIENRYDKKTDEYKVYKIVKCAVIDSEHTLTNQELEKKLSPIVSENIMDKDIINYINTIFILFIQKLAMSVSAYNYDLKKNIKGDTLYRIIRVICGNSIDNDSFYRLEEHLKK